jgi:hypothetical protein
MDRSAPRTFLRRISEPDFAQKSSMMVIVSMQLRVGKLQIKIPSWLIPVVGYIISIGSLVWVLQGVDLHTIWTDLFTLHWGWVAIAVFSDIAVYVYQAWRWNLLLNPVARFRCGRAK